MDLEQFEGHTPRPWYFWNNCDGVTRVGIGPTEELNVGVGFYETPEEMVSALLMASAPELLAHAKALEAKVEALSEERDLFRELVERTVKHADRLYLLIPSEMYQDFKQALTPSLLGGET